LAPAKGAGGRFIRREDKGKGKPVALGLKATDAAGGRRAAAACVEAERVSGQAQAEARRQRRAEALIQAIGWTNRACGEFNRYLVARAKRRQGQPKQQAPRGVAPVNDRIEHLYVQMVETALARWEALMAEGENARAVDFRNPAALPAI
jgi:alkyl sulfatase BDS1-like metallo-beta-lactamase superfamily hydrolase